jgi:ribosomal protein S21
MPKKIHRALARQATKKGLTGERRDRYVYGTLAKHKKRKKKGR